MISEVALVIKTFQIDLGWGFARSDSFILSCLPGCFFIFFDTSLFELLKAPIFFFLSAKTLLLSELFASSLCLSKLLLVYTILCISHFCSLTPLELLFFLSHHFLLRLVSEEFTRVGHLVDIVRANTDVTTLCILSLTAVDCWCNVCWLPWVRNIVLSSPVDNAIFQEWNLVITLASDGNGENNFVTLTPLKL